jgi:hypothetical protein
MYSETYLKAIELLENVATKDGFLASKQDISNYKRIWARDGVIIGLAALSSKNNLLINAFKDTLITLGKYQHKTGTIPSNVKIDAENVEVSYGGLAGRVDAQTWYIIGVCSYAIHTNDFEFANENQDKLKLCMALLDAWEFNNNHLIYTPLSGNWADEYIVDGYVLYDQLLRIYALQLYYFIFKEDVILIKINLIKNQIIQNFFLNSNGLKVHEKAFDNLNNNQFLPCSFSPAGYKNYFDTFAHSLLFLLDFNVNELKINIIEYSKSIINENKFQLMPAFWPIINEENQDWNLLKNNCKYEFRNHPFEFHNGGIWAMVNGFWGMAMYKINQKDYSKEILTHLNTLNSLDNYNFQENFNSQNLKAVGVPFCAWSAAATILLENTINHQFKLF